MNKYLKVTYSIAAAMLLCYVAIANLTFFFLWCNIRRLLEKDELSRVEITEQIQLDAAKFIRHVVECGIMRMFNIDRSKEEFVWQLGNLTEEMVNDLIQGLVHVTGREWFVILGAVVLLFLIACCLDILTLLCLGVVWVVVSFLIVNGKNKHRTRHGYRTRSKRR